MAKGKTGKAASNVPNKAAHIRVSFLYQAAAFVAQQQDVHTSTTPQSTNATPNTTAGIQTGESLRPVSRRLISDLRSVSNKTMIRMSPAMKHSICKNCNELLIDGSTCTYHVENKSRDGKKSWADVMVQKCNTCAVEKRFPLAPTRQKRRPHRGVGMQTSAKDA